MINEYAIEAKVKEDKEIQFILSRIEELKNETKETEVFAVSEPETNYHNFALSLQINALESYVAGQVRQSIDAARHPENSNEAEKEWRDDQQFAPSNEVDDSELDDIEETDRVGAN